MLKNSFTIMQLLWSLLNNLRFVTFIGLIGLVFSSISLYFIYEMNNKNHYLEDNIKKNEFKIDQINAQEIIMVYNKIIKNKPSTTENKSLTSARVQNSVNNCNDFLVQKNVLLDTLSSNNLKLRTLCNKVISMYDSVVTKSIKTFKIND